MWLRWTMAAFVAGALVAGWATLIRPKDDSRLEARAWGLVELLDDDDPDSVNRTLWELYQLEESAAPALVSLIRDDCSATSTNAGIVLDALEVRSVPYYVGALDNPNPRVRSAAAIRLSLLGMLETDSDESVRAARSAIPRLMELLDDEDTEVARHAGSALTNLLGPADKQYMPSLLAALRRQAERFASRSRYSEALFHYEPAHALASIGPDAVPALREALRDPLQETKEAAMEGLRRMGPGAAPAVPDVVELVRSQLRHGTPQLATFTEEKELLEQIGAEPGVPLLFEASRALGAIGEGATTAVPVLIEWIESESVPRRWQAVDALGRIGSTDRGAVPILIEALSDDEIDHYASEALARLGPDSIPALLEALQSKSTRVGALRALGLMGETAQVAGESVQLIFEGSEGIAKCEAAAALWQIGHDARPALAALADDCPDHREPLRNPGKEAAEAVSELYRRFAETPSRSDYAFALAKLGDPAIPSLVGALTHDNPRVRKEAAWTLERTVGDLQPAIARLASMLRDPEGPVRQAAGHTLRRAGPAVAPIIPDVAEALALEDDPYRWGVLVDVLLNAPGNAGSAVPILQKARHDDDFFTRFRADRALRAISKAKQVP